jgi:hypothetical protein
LSSSGFELIKSLNLKKNSKLILKISEMKKLLKKNFFEEKILKFKNTRKFNSNS